MKKPAGCDTKGEDAKAEVKNEPKQDKQDEAAPQVTDHEEHAQGN